MRSSSPEPLTAAYHDQHSARQASANPQEFPEIDGVTSNPTSPSPHTTIGRAPQLVSSTLQQPQSIPLDELSGRSPQLLSKGSPQALPPAYTRPSEMPSAQHEQPYWLPPPPANPSYGDAYLSQQQGYYQQYQQQPYPLPEEQPSSMWTHTGVSHPDDFLQSQQSINYSPGVTGSTSDAPEKPVYITSTPGRRRRKALWGCCLFIVALAIVLGIVFGVVLKDKDEDHNGSQLGDSSRSRTTSALSRATGTRTLQPTPNVLTPTDALRTTTATQPPTQTQPPATSPPTDRATCMRDCYDKFQDCLDECNVAAKECEAPCGGDLFCTNPCGFKEGDCRMTCHSTQARCRC